MSQCPKCLSANVHLEGRVEADLALLSEDEYVESCGDCGAEWVRNVTRTRLELLT